MKYLLLFAALCSFLNVQAQKFSNYKHGIYGRADYEHLDFSSDKQITYRYGKNSKDYHIPYLGKDGNSFKIQLPGNLIVKVTINSSNGLVLQGIGNNYAKTYEWEYEGPVNGRGTWCQQCTQDPKEAILLIKKYYLR